MLWNRKVPEIRFKAINTSGKPAGILMKDTDDSVNPILNDLEVERSTSGVLGSIRGTSRHATNEY